MVLVRHAYGLFRVTSMGGHFLSLFATVQLLDLFAWLCSCGKAMLLACCYPYVCSRVCQDLLQGLEPMGWWPYHPGQTIREKWAIMPFRSAAIGGVIFVRHFSCLVAW